MNIQQTGWKFVLIIISAFSFSSCISNKGILKEFPSPPLTLSKENINGVYLNAPDSVFHKISAVYNRPTLWQTLSDCSNHIFNKRIYTSENAVVTLTYLDDHTLKAVLTDSAMIKDSMILQVSEYKNHLSAKKLILIPIPILFFVFRNTRLMLSTEAIDELSIKRCKKQFAQIILTAGGVERAKLTFKKIKN